MEGILAEVSENNLNRDEPERSSRIAALSRRVNDWHARRRLRRTLSGEGIVPPGDHHEPSSSQESQTPAQFTETSSLFSSTPLRQAIPPSTSSFRHTQISQMRCTSASNSRIQQSQLTPAELSQVFLHSTSSRAERQQNTWDEILQYLRSQVNVEKEMIELVREIRKEIQHLQGRTGGVQEEGRTGRDTSEF